MSTRRHYEPEIESMDREQLERLQWEAFKSEILNASETPFYHDRFKKAEFSPDSVRSPQDVAAIPLTRKEELCNDIEEHPPYGSRLRVPSSQLVGIVETSGTSGRGKEVHVYTTSDKERIIRMEAYGFRWAGVEEGTVVAFTLPIGMTAAGTWWWLALDRLGANTLRLGDFDTETKLAYMMRYGAQVIVSTPAYVTRLEQTARDSGIDLRRDLPTMSSIIVAGEAKTAAWVAEREEVWGARCYEQWGCSAGAVAWSCEEGMTANGELGLVHWLPHLAFMEVVDPESGQQVRDGEYGELIITPLGVEGAPLIRFATGDRVRFLEPKSCRCGRPFAGIQAGSVSRYDDMVKVKGVNVWPSAVASVVESFSEVAEHRVTVYLDEGSRERLRLEIELRPTAAEAAKSVLRELTGRLRAVTGINFDVVLWEDSAPLSSKVFAGHSGKVKRWQDLRSTGPTAV